MTEIPPTFPFSKLTLHDHETPLWVGYNPTFHRFFQYGLVISDAALYLCSRAWLFANWKRYPLAELSDVVVGAHGTRASIKFRVGDRVVNFSVPGDSYADEMDFDRGVLSKAAAFLQSRS
jgi:hypothetical protein